MDVANRRPMQQAVDLLDPRAGERICDIGCGTGAASRRIARDQACSILGVDRSETMLAAANRAARRAGLSHSCSYLHGDLADLALETESFDAVLALNVLYFCDAQSRMIAAMRRLLKPGGRLVGYVTDRATMENWAFARSGTHRLFDAGQLHHAFVVGGFRTDRIAIESRRIARKITGLFVVAGA